MTGGEVSSSAGTGTLFVISGPSGVGKGTIIAEVRRRRPDLWLSVSTTTRGPRPGEVSGREYLFVSPAEFEAGIAAGEFLEWAEYAGNRYGTSSVPVADRLRSGQSVILEIELAGARQVRRQFPDAVLVLIVPPDLAVLESRLRGRGTEDEAALAARLATAREELAAAAEFDAVIVNGEIVTAAAELLQLVDKYSQQQSGPGDQSESDIGQNPSEAGAGATEQ